MKRRNFISSIGKFTFAGVGTLFLSNFLSSCEKDEGILNLLTETIKLDEYKSLLEIGGIAAVFFKNTPIPILVKRVSDSEFIVVDRTCTHQGCTVGMPNNELKYMECPCHGARFSVEDFSVLQNPDDGTQIKPLKKYGYIFDKNKNELIIDFTEVL